MDLLAELRDLFGAATMTEEQAIGAVRQAHATATANTTAASDLTAARGTIGEKDTEITALKAKIPAPVDPKLAAGFVNLACKEVDHLLTSACLIGEQAALLKADLMSEGKPKLSAVDADGSLTYSQDAVHKVLQLNRPLVKTGEQTGLQREARVVPGSSDGSFSSEEQKADQASRNHVAQKNGNAA